MRDLGDIIDEVTKHLGGTGNDVTLTVEICSVCMNCLYHGPVTSLSSKHC